jgi:predicted glycosyltransferase involved in capsule biosynthesis
MKLAVIIPYRDRKQHLEIFLREFPKRVNVKDYIIIVVEQTEEKLFNRGKLINVGFDYIKDKVDYICFHDVDMIPIEADYSYSDTPLHMATNCSQFGKKLPYPDYYGGVNLMSNENYIKINGFPNFFWGWGVEDDDLLSRVREAGYKLERRIGYYASLPHQKSPSNRNENLKKFYSNYDKSKEGLSNVDYQILEEVKLNDFTIKIKVKI